jgi:hypothetical protein
MKHGILDDAEIRDYQKARTVQWCSQKNERSGYRREILGVFIFLLSFPEETRIQEEQKNP